MRAFSLIAVPLVTTTLMTGVSTTANAAPSEEPTSSVNTTPACNYVTWQYASWGRAKLCTSGSSGSYGQISDYGAADGYCVHAKVFNGGTWKTIPGSTSCDSTIKDWSTSLPGATRMVNGNGRYDTL